MLFGSCSSDLVENKGLFMISINIEDYLPTNDEYAQVEEVVFHTYVDSENRRRFLGSVILQGEENSVKGRALDIIEDALTKLIFASGMDLRINDNDYYITPLESFVSVHSSLIGEKSIHRVGAMSTQKYRIGDDRTKSTLANMKCVKHDKKNSLVKALNIYRVGVESSNPYQAIETYFSSMKTIVRENTGTKYVTQADLKCELKKTVGSGNDFNSNFSKFYGKERSGGITGSLDLLDRSSSRIVMESAALKYRCNNSFFLFLSSKSFD